MAVEPMRPTERDFDLIEVALESCAETCQAGVLLRGSKAIDPLAAEYVHALTAVQRWRKEVANV